MNSYEFYQKFAISKEVYNLASEASKDLLPYHSSIEKITEARQLELIDAFHEARVSESSFLNKNGYGYDDFGREQTEKVFAKAFQAEDALVRIQMSSGTEVLAACLRGLLHANDDILIVTGVPYDTILPTLGEAKLYSSEHEEFSIDLKYSESRHSLAARGVSVRILPLTDAEMLDLEKIKAAILPNTKMLYVQKSRGYSQRRAVLSREVQELHNLIASTKYKPIIMVDNCYGEFVERYEPTAYGADLIAGSLIKNPGAGIAPTGGYICGKSDLLEEIAQSVTAVGVGSEIGPSLGYTRAILQGIYFAPQVVSEAKLGAIFTSILFQKAGFSVDPLPDEERGDIVQTVDLASSEKLTKFCEAVQSAAPIDAQFAPVPSPMPGYDCDIIMASGSFIQGSSIELSADGPLRPPYTAFMQGGLNFTNIRLASMLALERVISL